MAVLGLGLGPGVVACTSTATTLDRRATEDAVERAARRRLDVDLARVTCPADLPRGAGRRVTCRITLADDVGIVHALVRQTDGDGGLEVTLVEAVLDARDIADDLGSRLASDFGHPFLVDCGPPGPAVREPGASVACKAADGDGTQVVQATVVDAAGSLTFEIQP